MSSKQGFGNLLMVELDHSEHCFRKNNLDTSWFHDIPFFELRWLLRNTGISCTYDWLKGATPLPALPGEPK
jgi:hypothetical protein